MPDPKKYKRDAVENGDEDRGVVAMAGGIVALAGGRAEGEARLTRALVEMSPPAMGSLVLPPAMGSITNLLMEICRI